MTTRQYLNRGYGIKKEIEILNSVIQEIRENIDGVKGISYAGIKVQGGPLKDEGPILDKISKMQDIEKKINKAKHELVFFQEELCEKIFKIQDSNERNILYLRYIVNLKWEEIYKKIGYSHSQTHRIHKEALENIKKIKME